jgi:hypothetical protein
MNHFIGKPLSEVVSTFTATGLLTLASNDSDDFAIEFRRGNHVYRKQPTHLCKASVIDAAIATMSGRTRGNRQVTFIPSSQKRFFPKSCWGGVKVSATPANKNDVVDRRVRSLFTCLRAYAYGRSIIVERCGDGSWQFWAIRNGFSAHTTWWRLLRKVNSEAGVTGEIFPREDGLGMPAPGSWDPNTGRLSHIVYADLTAIFPEPVYSAFDSAALPTAASPVVTSNGKS